MDTILDVHPDMNTTPGATYLANTRPIVDSARRSTPRAPVSRLSELRKQLSAKKIE